MSADAEEPLEPPSEEVEESLLQVAFSEIRDTSPEIFSQLGRTYQPGEILFRENDNSKELFMIVGGQVKISRGDNQNEKMLAVLSPGEIMGEMSHFDNYPRSATATAVTEVQVLVFTKANFALIFELHHKWTLQLVYSLCNRVYSTFGRVLQGHTMLAAANAKTPAGS
ncbi:MAG: cyclic nucleotide-binding domain-containing protein [Candidatus Wallbacteria bacterium]|nr:cyclic nucleotide-binding domain-containing protein [Candidatus Wallbacteria bacterium]